MSGRRDELVHPRRTAITAAPLLGLLCGRERRGARAVPAAAAALARAWSRTCLNVHWLADVTGGLALGAAAGQGALAAPTRRLGSARVATLPDHERQALTCR